MSNISSRFPWIQSSLEQRRKWSKRELARQIKTAAFERTIQSDKKLAPAVRVLPQDATGVFKDSFLLDFLDLPQRHSEADLQTSLQRNLRRFLMELGDGFAEVPEHWSVGAIKDFVQQRTGLIKTGPFGSHLTSAEMEAGTIKVYNQPSVSGLSSRTRHSHR